MYIDCVTLFYIMDGSIYLSNRPTTHCDINFASTTKIRHKVINWKLEKTSINLIFVNKSKLFALICNLFIILYCIHHYYALRKKYIVLYENQKWVAWTIKDQIISPSLCIPLPVIHSILSFNSLSSCVS